MNPNKLNDPLTLLIISKLEELKESKGLTQNDIAIKAGINHSHFACILYGHQRLSLINLYKIAEALEVEAYELLPTKDEYNKYKDKKVVKNITLQILED